MGILLVYDVTNVKSFDNIAKWLRNIDEHANEDVEKIIIGNKCDMEDRRVIPTERGEAIAREHGIRFIETSAKANINIDRVFLELTDAILAKTTAKEANDAGNSASNATSGRVFISRTDSTGKSSFRCCSS